MVTRPPNLQYIFVGESDTISPEMTFLNIAPNLREVHLKGSVTRKYMLPPNPNLTVRLTASCADDCVEILQCFPNIARCSLYIEEFYEDPGHVIAPNLESLELDFDVTDRMAPFIEQFFCLSHLACFAPIRMAWQFRNLSAFEFRLPYVSVIVPTTNPEVLLPPNGRESLNGMPSCHVICHHPVIEVYSIHQQYLRNVESSPPILDDPPGHAHVAPQSGGV